MEIPRAVAIGGFEDAVVSDPWLGWRCLLFCRSGTQPRAGTTGLRRAGGGAGRQGAEAYRCRHHGRPLCGGNPGVPARGAVFHRRLFVRRAVRLRGRAAAPRFRPAGGHARAFRQRSGGHDFLDRHALCDPALHLPSEAAVENAEPRPARVLQAKLDRLAGKDDFRPPTTSAIPCRIRATVARRSRCGRLLSCPYAGAPAPSVSGSGDCFRE